MLISYAAAHVLGRAIQFYESQPKAWAEYRYTAKLIYVGGGRPIWAISGRWSPELGAGSSKKGWYSWGVLKLEREGLRET